ncbi:MAG TPA: hypothetical protein VG738_13325 [Chitinophagaceae bacterium]|nr:hypothetical protein [Chitinophagaceae bacterium]
MHTSKLITLIVKIFVSAAIAGAVVFFAAVYIDSAIISIVLPENTHVEPTFTGAVTYALYNSIEMSLFFTMFILLIMRLSISAGVIFTLRDIIQYYKKYLLTTLVVVLALACILCVIISNAFSDLRYINNALLSGSIITYTLPIFWFILAALYYKGYQSKISERDGSKDRSWLEGNFEK